MEDGKASSKNNLISAAAFVEGGVQDACDDACSICLDEFCDSEPSTVTSCKHEFHLQCILEWCQRSIQCPMCWQPISLKDPSSQELLDAVEHERNVRMNPPRSAIFHHPTLGDFELQNLPVNATESELEEQIIQHLAAAAAMGRARQLARRENQRNSRSSAQGRPQFLVFSTNSNGASSPNGSNTSLITAADDSSQLIAQPSSDQLMVSGSSAAGNQYGTSSSNRRSPAQTSPGSQDRAGPSDLQSFSDNLRSRLTALSSRYKESLNKSTRGWKERLFARNSNNNTSIITVTPPSAEIQGVTAGQTTLATMSRMMDHLEIGEDSGTHTVSRNVEEDESTANLIEEQETAVEMGSSRNLTEDNNTRVPCAAASSASSS